jgi:hypothetical protein
MNEQDQQRPNIDEKSDAMRRADIANGEAATNDASAHRQERTMNESPEPVLPPPTRPFPDMPDEPTPVPMPGDPPSGDRVVPEPMPPEPLPS